MKATTRLLEDMLDAIEAIESYAVRSYEEFLADEKTQDDHHVQFDHSGGSSKSNS